MISFNELKKAAKLNPNGIIRLAQFVGIKTKNFHINEIINLLLYYFNKK
jgi:hypothetical protein